MIHIINFDITFYSFQEQTAKRELYAKCESSLELSAAVLVPLVGLPDLFLVVLAQPLPKAAEAFLT